MERPLIMMTSVTYAMRGRELLQRYGISAEVRRTPKNTRRQGCGYSLYVPSKTDEAEQLLKKNGIKIIGRTAKEGEP